MCLARRIIIPATLAAGLIGARPAGATNGMFANGYGGEAKGMAGAGVTLGVGPLANAQNPALGAGMGNVAGICFTQFMPHRDVRFNGPGPFPEGDFHSKNDWFPIVCGGVNMMLRPDTAIGLSIYANGGMNTHYDRPLFANFGPGATAPTGVDMAQMFIAANVAHRFTDRLTVGFAPVMAVQRLRVQGLEPFEFMSASPSHVTNNGYDYSVGGGAKIGFTYDINKYLVVGASYQSRMFMTSFSRYKGLLAEGGTFDIPAFVNDGIAVKPIENLAVLIEHQRIFYGGVKAIANDGVPPFGPLGSDNGAGFGWKDMDIFKLGLQWKASADLTLRTGVSWSTDFTTRKQVLFNTLAPATPTTHASVGFTYAFAPGYALTMAYTHAFSHSLTGSTPGLMGAQTETLRMDQDEVLTGLSIRF